VAPRAKKAAKKSASNAAQEAPSFEGYPIVTDESGDREWRFIGAMGLGRNILVISCRSYKGKRALDLRQFYLAKETEYRPTGKGVWIPADVVTDVLDTLAQARPVIDEELEL